MRHTGVKLKSGLDLDVEEGENTQKQVRREGIQVRIRQKTRRPYRLALTLTAGRPLIPVICSGKLGFFSSISRL